MQTRDTLPEQLDATGRAFAVRRMLGDNLFETLVSRQRVPALNLAEDVSLLRAGVLDRRSFRSGYALAQDPTEFVFTRLMRTDEVVNPALIVRDPRFFTEPLQVGKNSFVDKAFGGCQRVYTAIRRQHNLRTILGRDQWQRLAMFGDIAAVTATASSASVATSSGATSLANTLAAFPTSVADAVTASNTTVTSATAAFTQMDVGRLVSGTNIPANTCIVAVASATSCTISQAASGSGSGGTFTIARLQGKIIVAETATSKVFGVIVNNTATVITVDQWYDPTSTTGAAGSNPTATSNYVIPGSAALSRWLGLCATGGSGNPPVGGHTPSNTTQPDGATTIGDALRLADGLFGNGTFTGASSEQTASGLGRIFVPPTFPAAGQIQFSNVFTYTGSLVVTVDVGILCDSKAAAGSLMLLETQLNASAQVSANGDTITPTWTINL